MHRITQKLCVVVGKVRSLSSFTHINDSNAPTMVDVGDKASTKRVAHAQVHVIFPQGITSKLLQVSSGSAATATTTTTTSKSITTNSKTNGSHSGFGSGLEMMGPKGPIFATAIVAGIQASKRTSELIPMCHQLSLDKCTININMHDEDPNIVVIDCIATTTGKTGVEMEALVGASNSALTIYDMVKALSHDIVISNLHLVSKTGGKSDVQKKI